MTVEEFDRLREGDFVYWAHVVEFLEISETIELKLCQIHDTYMRFVHLKTGRTYLFNTSPNNDVTQFLYRTKSDADEITGKFKFNKKKKKSEYDDIKELLDSDDEDKEVEDED